MKKYLYLFVFFFINTTSGQDLISKMYCNILGNSDCKIEYRDLTRKALKDFGIQNLETIAIKKMNNVGSIIALVPVSSFTAFGIWFNEKYLDSCSSEERTFQIYHEVAHYALRHHQKLLTILGGLSFSSIIGLIYFYKNLNKNIYSLPITTVLITTLIYLGILPNLVRHQEREADIEATKKLISLGKRNIIMNHIKILNNSKSPEKGNIWWFSDKEQAEYLNKDLIIP